MYFGTSVSFLKSLLNSGIFHKKFLDCSIKSWCAAILCMLALLFVISACSIGKKCTYTQDGTKIESWFWFTKTVPIDLDKNNCN